MRGSVILSILITFVVAAIVIMGLSALNKVQGNAAAFTMYKYEMDYMDANVRNFLFTPSNCIKNFSGRDPNIKSSLITSIVDPSDTVKYSNSLSYGNGLLRIHGFEFGDPASAVPTNGTGTTFLNVVYEKQKDALGAKQVARPIVINVTTVAGAVTNCSAAVLTPPVASDTKVERVDRYACVAPRKGVCEQLTGTAYSYEMCSLATVRSGGDEGGGEDVCRVDQMIDGQWRIYGRRGDDPAIECAMYCIDFDTEDTDTAADTAPPADVTSGPPADAPAPVWKVSKTKGNWICTQPCVGHLGTACSPGGAYNECYYSFWGAGSPAYGCVETQCAIGSAVPSATAPTPSAATPTPTPDPSSPYAWTMGGGIAWSTGHSTQSCSGLVGLPCAPYGDIQGCFVTANGATLAYNIGCGVSPSAPTPVPVPSPTPVPTGHWVLESTESTGCKKKLCPFLGNPCTVGDYAFCCIPAGVSKDYVCQP